MSDLDTFCLHVPLAGVGSHTGFVFAWLQARFLTKSDGEFDRGGVR